MPENTSGLCHQCRVDGRTNCAFIQKVDEAIALHESQLTDDLQACALATHGVIANFRITHREDGCPYINEHNPDYTGKNTL